MRAEAYRFAMSESGNIDLPSKDSMYQPLPKVHSNCDE